MKPPLSAVSPDVDSIKIKIERRARALGYEIPSQALERLAHHLAMTLKWAQAMSLTSIRSAQEAVDRHVMESVAASQEVDPSKGPMLDVGSGNGYPAIPIKCLHPEMVVILLEPNLRRAVFLRQVASALAFEGIEIRRERLNEPDELLKYAPLGTIVMRAVDAVDAVIGGAKEALGPGGRVILLAGLAKADQLVATLPDGLRLHKRATLHGRGRSQLLVIVKAM